MERKLGSKIIRVTKGSRRIFKKKWDYVYDVPLLASLAQLLSVPFVLEEVNCVCVCVCVCITFYCDDIFSHTCHNGTNQ